MVFGVVGRCLSLWAACVVVFGVAGFWWSYGSIVLVFDWFGLMVVIWLVLVWLQYGWCL